MVLINYIIPDGVGLGLSREVRIKASVESSAVPRVGDDVKIDFTTWKVKSVEFVINNTDEGLEQEVDVIID